MNTKVPVYERILDLFEAEGINTIFGIPDPNFVHMFHLAEERGWNVVAPHHEEAAGFMAEGLPVGIELMGRAFTDVRLVSLAYAVQAITLWMLPRFGALAMPQTQTHAARKRLRLICLPQV